MRLGVSDTGALTGVGTLGLRVDGQSAYVERLYGTVSAVPEVATWAMMLAGIGAIGTALRATRRRVRYTPALT